MHPAAQAYCNLSPDQQQRVQIVLCVRALAVWEALVPATIDYHESVAGTRQQFDASVPRAALGVVQSGQHDHALDALYREPLAALQDEDVALPDKALFAYYAIRNLYVANALQRPLDGSLVVHQALAAVGEDDGGPALTAAVNSVVAGATWPVRSWKPRH